MEELLEMSTRSLLMIATAIFLAVVAGVAGYFYHDVFSDGGSAVAIPEAGENEKILYIFFPNLDEGGDGFELEARVIPADLTGAELGEEVIRQIIAGPNGEAARVFSPGTELRALYADAGGTVYIDLDRAAFRIPVDAGGEVLMMEAVRESIQRNVEGVTGIKMLVDSEETDTLWGHVDATRPWRGSGG